MPACLALAHEHACFAGCTNMGLTGMVFVRGYSCRAKPGSCRGACREPKVGMARRRLAKVDGAGMSNGSRIACNSTFKSKRRRAVPAAKPLGKPPRFVVARSANPICRHIWNSICGIAAMLTNRVFVHKSLGTPMRRRSARRRSEGPSEGIRRIRRGLPEEEPSDAASRLN